MTSTAQWSHGNINKRTTKQNIDWFTSTRDMCLLGNILNALHYNLHLLIEYQSLSRQEYQSPRCVKINSSLLLCKGSSEQSTKYKHRTHSTQTPLKLVACTRKKFHVSNEYKYTNTNIVLDVIRQFSSSENSWSSSLGGSSLGGSFSC